MSKVVKQGDYDSIREKAKQIYRGGGVNIMAITETFCNATVRSTTGNEYTVVLHYQGPGSAEQEKVALWECTCPWATYAWGRTRQWTKYEGRMCAHSLATLFYLSAFRSMMRTK